MRSISLAVSESDYEAFRRAASHDGVSIAHLIREAMAEYRLRRIDRLEHLPLLVGHRPVGELPSRSEVYDEAFSAR